MVLDKDLFLLFPVLSKLKRKKKKRRKKRLTILPFSVEINWTFGVNEQQNKSQHPAIF